MMQSAVLFIPDKIQKGIGEFYGTNKRDYSGDVDAI